MAPDGGVRSKLRLFLSMDIAGSTAMKGEINYQALADRVKYTKRVLDAVQLPDHFDRLVDAGLPASKEEFDWATILSYTFNDFHTAFSSGLQGKVDAHELYPWKALGDELVYSFNIRTRETLSKILCHFLSTLRSFDHKLGCGGKIRMKGTAWVAGFPIRNREIDLPMPSVSFAGGDGKPVEFPYPKLDFLGPDMDVGFRLGKCSFPGMCVASLELVDVLGVHVSSMQIRATHVGWERLKGVWGDRPYPIFWLDLPKGHKDEKAPRFAGPWEEAESALYRAWLDEEKKVEVKELQGLVGKIRTHLPRQFGVVTPYIVGDNEDVVHPEHQELLELLTRLNTKGDTAPPPTSRGEPVASLSSSEVSRVIADVESLIDKVDPPTSSDGS